MAETEPRLKGRTFGDVSSSLERSRNSLSTVNPNVLIDMSIAMVEMSTYLSKLSSQVEEGPERENLLKEIERESLRLEGALVVAEFTLQLIDRRIVVEELIRPATRLINRVKPPQQGVLH